MTRVHRPRDLKQLLLARAEHREAVLLAGGAQLMAQVRAGQRPRDVIDLWSVSELRGVERGRREVWIGALTTLGALRQDRFLNKVHPTLVQACAEVVPQRQNRATLGGSLVSGRAELLPACLIADAEVELQSLAGSRRVPLAEHQGVAPSQVLTAIHLPHPHADDRRFLRAIQGHGGLRVAARVRLSDGHIRQARVVVATQSHRAARVPELEACMEGHPLRPSEAQLLREALPGATGVVASRVLRSWLESLL